MKKEAQERTVHSGKSVYKVKGAMRRNPQTGAMIPVVGVWRDGRPVHKPGADTLGDHLSEQMVLRMTKSSAEDAEEDYLRPAAATALTGGGLGLAASPTTRGRLFGFKRVYHGTLPEAAKAIREQGLDPKFGGTGASAAVDVKQYMDDSKGKVHVTPRRMNANPYAHQDRLKGSEADMMREFALSHFRPTGRDRMITADIPSDMWDRFEVDPDAIDPAVRNIVGDSMAKDVAARSEEAIDPRYIHNLSPARAVDRTLDLLKRFPDYVRARPGRFGLGLAGMGLGTAAALKGGSDLAEYVQNEQEKKAMDLKGPDYYKESHRRNPGVPLQTHKAWWALPPEQRTRENLMKIRSQEKTASFYTAVPGALGGAITGATLGGALSDDDRRGRGALIGGVGGALLGSGGAHLLGRRAERNVDAAADALSKSTRSLIGEYGKGSALHSRQAEETVASLANVRKKIEEAFRNPNRDEIVGVLEGLGAQEKKLVAQRRRIHDAEQAAFDARLAEAQRVNAGLEQALLETPGPSIRNSAFLGLGLGAGVGIPAGLLNRQEKTASLKDMFRRESGRLSTAELTALSTLPVAVGTAAGVHYAVSPKTRKLKKKLRSDPDYQKKRDEEFGNDDFWSTPEGKRLDREEAKRLLGLKKTAIDAAELARAAKRVAAERIPSEMLKPFGAFLAPTRRQMKRMEELGTPEYQKGLLPKQYEDELGRVIGEHPGSVFAEPGAGRMISPSAPKSTVDQLDQVAAVHEGLERSVKPHEVQWSSLHASPKVPAQELNMINSATPDVSDAMERLRALREAGGEHDLLRSQLQDQFGPEASQFMEPGRRIPKAMLKRLSTAPRDQIDPSLAREMMGRQQRHLMNDVPPVAKRSKPTSAKTTHTEFDVNDPSLPDDVKRALKKTGADTTKPKTVITRKEHNVIKEQLKEHEKKRKAEKDLEKLVGSKPSAAQLARHAVIGAGVGSLMRPIGTVIEGVEPGKNLAREALNPRGIARNMATTAAFMMAAPVAKYYVDREAAKRGKY